MFLASAAQIIFLKKQIIFSYNTQLSLPLHMLYRKNNISTGTFYFFFNLGAKWGWVVNIATLATLPLGM
jgi:hypothetical protein